MVGPAENTTTADEALLRMHAEGDADALKTLYDRYGRKVFATVFRMLGDSHEAADLVQECFVKVHLEAAGFRAQSKFSTWLFRIAVNLAIDRTRSLKNRPKPVDEFEKRAEEITVPAAQGRWTSEEIDCAIGKLSPKLRAVIVLRYTEGLSYEDIRDVLDCSEGTVKSRLCRAHEELQRLLAG
jgi:RNA polymerase sigma-70 factor (ECF subfamily)